MTTLDEFIKELLQDPVFKERYDALKRELPQESIGITEADAFRKSLDEAALWAKEAGFTENDVNDII